MPSSTCIKIITQQTELYPLLKGKHNPLKSIIIIIIIKKHTAEYYSTNILISFDWDLNCTAYVWYLVFTVCILLTGHFFIWHHTCNYIHIAYISFDSPWPLDFYINIFPPLFYISNLGFCCFVLLEGIRVSRA